MTLSDLGRNNVNAAVEYVRGLLDSGGSFGPDEAQVLLTLQDDVAPLVTALEALYAERSALGKTTPEFWSADDA